MVDFGYANARVRAHKSYLLERSFYERLIDAPNFDEAIGILLTTYYKEDLERGFLKGRNIEGAEEGLKIHFLREMRKLYGWVDPPIKRLLNIIFGRWDVHNLKTILRGKHHGVSLEEIKESFFAVGTLSEALLIELAKQVDIKAVIDLLATWESPYALPLTEVFPQYNEERKLMILELSLDKFYYSFALRELRQRNLSVQLVREVFRREIDFINIMSLMKGVREKLEKEEIENFFIPGGKLLTFEKYKDLTSSESPEEIVEGLRRTPYEVPLREGFKDFAKKGLLSYVERRMEEHIIKSVVSLFKADPLSMAIILAYIWAKFNEVVNLRIVLRGKAVGMREESIREALVFV
jgi:V/A-type H+-transporting ATPase subunit C